MGLKPLAYNPSEIIYDAPDPPQVQPRQVEPQPFPTFRDPARERERRLRYRPLARGHIRILIIRPASDRNDPIEIDIVHTLLPPRGSNERVPAYSALSYEWGTDPPNHRVVVRDHVQKAAEMERVTTQKDRWRCLTQHVIIGSRLRIRFNLLEALRELRGVGGAPLRFWVDALCINQFNDEEKSQQIARMHEIYNSASNVCVWLGTNQAQTDIGMDFVVELSRSRSTSAEATLFKGEYDQKWDGLILLLRSRWFSRRWIVQEISVAKAASVHCGTKKVPWEDLRNAIHRFCKVVDDLKTSLGFKPPETRTTYEAETLDFVEACGARTLTRLTLQVVDRYELIHSKTGEITKKLNLESLVSQLLAFESGDPRDMIYALLAIARNDPKQTIIADYRKSVLEVYVDFVKYTYLQTKSLNIICRHWAPINTEVIAKTNDVQSSVLYLKRLKTTLPSWISSVDKSACGPPAMSFRGRHHAEALVDRGSRWNASGVMEGRAFFGRRETPLTTENNYLLETYDGTLTVHGVLLAPIQKVSARIDRHKLRREELEMAGWDPRSSGENSAEDVPDELWRTLMTDSDEYGYQPEDAHRMACLYVLQSANVDGDINYRDLLSDPDLRASHDIYKFVKRVQQVTTNRRFFLTGDGEHKVYSGLCPQEASASEDDHIALIAGCSVPVVLRRLMEKPLLGQEVDNSPAGTPASSVRSASPIGPGPSSSSPLTASKPSATKKRKTSDSAPGSRLSPSYSKLAQASLSGVASPSDTESRSLKSEAKRLGRT